VRHALMYGAQVHVHIWYAAFGVYWAFGILHGAEGHFALERVPDVLAPPCCTYVYMSSATARRIDCGALVPVHVEYMRVCTVAPAHTAPSRVAITCGPVRAPLHRAVV
jgi:hypothetical protein